MVHLLIAPGTGGETRPIRYKDEPQDNIMRGACNTTAYRAATATISSRRYVNAK